MTRCSEVCLDAPSEDDERIVLARICATTALRAEAALTPSALGRAVKEHARTKHEPSLRRNLPCDAGTGCSDREVCKPNPSGGKVTGIEISDLQFESVGTSGCPKGQLKWEVTGKVEYVIEMCCKCIPIPKESTAR